jgi:hypothetical protein
MTTGGLYISPDSGQSWERVPGAVSDDFFGAVATSNELGVFFAASTTEGIFKVKWNIVAANQPYLRSQTQPQPAKAITTPVN